MAISPYGDMKYDDAAGMAQWMARHALRHRLYAKALLRKGVVGPALPIADAFGREWLLAHQAHHRILNQYFVPGSTNLYNLTVDPMADQSQFYAWMRAHNLMHLRIDRKFNSVVRS